MRRPADLDLVHDSRTPGVYDSRVWCTRATMAQTRASSCWVPWH